MHRLIDAGLIGAERAAALQHERDAVAALRPPQPFDLRRVLRRSDRDGLGRLDTQIRRNLVHGATHNA